MSVTQAPRFRGGLLVAATAMIALALSGCASGAAVTVDAFSTDSVTVPAGQDLVVDFGEINSSTGDDWVIITEPDAAVLSPGESQSEQVGDGAPGSPNLFSYRFVAIEAGTTSIEFQYQFQGSVPDLESEQENIVIDVTVE